MADLLRDSLIDRSADKDVDAVRLAGTGAGQERGVRARMVARAVVLAEGRELLLGDLPDALRQGLAAEAPTVRIQPVHASLAPVDEPEVIPPEGLDLDQLLAEVERKWLVAALRSANGNKTRAARALRMSFRSFRYRLAKYDLDH